jgi:hypothetical protein
MASDELRHHMMKPPTLGSIGHVVGVRSDDAKAVDDGCMLGGVVSCKLASEVHVNGLWVSTIRRSEAKSPKTLSLDNEEASPKRLRLVSVEGREIIGPGYATHMAVIGVKKQRDNSIGAGESKMVGLSGRREKEGHTDWGGGGRLRTKVRKLIRQ